MNYINKKGMIIVLIAFMIFMIAVGCSDNSEEVTTDPVQEPEEVTTDPVQEPEEVIQYVENDSINSFIIAFTEATGKEMTDIDNSSRKYRATAHCDGYRFIMEDLDGEFRVNVEQTADTSEYGVSGMNTIVYNVINAMDSTITEEAFNQLFDEVVDGYKSDNEIGSVILTFYPDTNNSRGHFTISKKN